MFMAGVVSVCHFPLSLCSFIKHTHRVHVVASLSPWSEKKIRMDDLGATVPPIVKYYNLQHAKKKHTSFASFGLINFIYTQIHVENLSTMKFFM